MDGPTGVWTGGQMDGQTDTGDDNNPLAFGAER